MKNQIFFDMDGVIADFTEGFKQAFGRDARELDSFTIKQYCLTRPNFFRELPVNDLGLELFNSLKNDYNITFLTTPMEGMNFCKRDKIIWIQENLGNYDVIFSSNKAEYVEDHESVLIDDFQTNLEPWRDAGGTAIKFPQKIDKIMTVIENVFNPEKEVRKIRKQIIEMDVNENPTKSQKLSGIYKKGNVNFKYMNIKIENPKGSIRFGFDESGKKWVQRLNSHYGYITGTEGSDFDPVDCFIGPSLNKSLAYVVNQGKEGMFDEHKIMLGFESMEEAKQGYLDNYQKGWDGLMSIKQTNTKKLRKWLKEGNTNEPF
jgi:5'(3')-deoxyribonucleotidase